MMGLMSTPKAGGTTRRVTLRKGSVGQAIRFAGNLFKSTCGYHDRTIRTKNATPPRSKRGSITAFAGETQLLAASSNTVPVFSANGMLDGSIVMRKEELAMRGAGGAN